LLVAAAATAAAKSHAQLLISIGARDGDFDGDGDGDGGTRLSFASGDVLDVHAGDGGGGVGGDSITWLPPGRRFALIHCGASVAAVPPFLLRRLAPGGALVIPVNVNVAASDDSGISNGSGGKGGGGGVNEQRLLVFRLTDTDVDAVADADADADEDFDADIDAAIGCDKGWVTVTTDSCRAFGVAADDIGDFDDAHKLTVKVVMACVFAPMRTAADAAARAAAEIAAVAAAAAAPSAASLRAEIAAWHAKFAADNGGAKPSLAQMRGDAAMGSLMAAYAEASRREKMMTASD
jgi:hypothetical protein